MSCRTPIHLEYDIETCEITKHKRLLWISRIVKTKSKPVYNDQPSGQVDVVAPDRWSQTTGRHRLQPFDPCLFHWKCVSSEGCLTIAICYMNLCKFGEVVGSRINRRFVLASILLADNPERFSVSRCPEIGAYDVRGCVAEHYGIIFVTKHQWVVKLPNLTVTFSHQIRSKVKKKIRLKTFRNNRRKK